MAVYEPGSRLSPDAKHVGVLILDFPASRTQFLVYKTHSLWYFCYSDPNGLRHKTTGSDGPASVFKQRHGMTQGLEERLLQQQSGRWMEGMRLRGEKTGH